MTAIMKLKNVFQYNGVLLAFTVAAVFMGCEDQPDKYEVADGTPTVDYIRCLSSEIESSSDDEDTHHTNGELVTEASPQSTLCLVGENLRSVYEIYFNDQQAILNTSYITDNTLIVDVPKSVPSKVTDKMYLVTRDKDTVDVDFHVIISAPSVTSMSNEYAAVGDEVTLTGSYFIDDPGTPLTVAFTTADGGKVYVDHDDITFSDDYSTLSFPVPEGADEGPLTVSSIYGTTKTALYYKDTRGLLFDFDGVTGLGNHGWHDRPITTDANAVSGNYVQLGNGTAKMSAAGDWDDSDFAFQYWPGSWNTPTDYPEREGVKLTSLVDCSNWENMSLQFEMCIPSEYPWQAGAMQIVFAGIDKVSYGNAGTDVNGDVVAGPGNDYMQTSTLPRALYRPWTATGSYDTDGKWVTVTLPLKSSFIYGYDGSVSSGTLSASDFTSLVIFIVGGGISGTECTPLIKIDNIRLVPYK
jgi:hypothetical protein